MIHAPETLRAIAERQAAGRRLRTCARETRELVREAGALFLLLFAPIPQLPEVPHEDPRPAR
jgi:hypothetical protein